MILELDMASTIPIYQQIRDQVVIGLAKKELLPGELLPTVRQLAEDIGVNSMTVSKAYTLLKEEGYLETDRRQGSKVKRQQKEKKHVKRDIEKNLKLILAEAVIQQLSLDEVQTICQKLYTDFNKKEDDAK